MRVLEYKIQKQIFVKAEITKLTAYPIVNNSDNFYLVIPTLISELPDNIMFIQENILVNPHTTVNYIPKVVKLGVTLSQSVASQLPRGIEIKLIIFDNITDEVQSVTNIDYIKAKNERAKKNNNIDDNKNKNAYVYDGQKVIVGEEQYNILQGIDKILERKENRQDVIQQDENQNKKVQMQPNLLQQDTSSNTTNQVVNKRGRGRPRKNPVVLQDEPSVLQSILTEDETQN